MIIANGNDATIGLELDFADNFMPINTFFSVIKEPFFIILF